MTQRCRFLSANSSSAYELLANIVVLGVMFFLARRLRRPGVLMLVYLFSYVTTQFSLFFVRDNLVVSFLGLNWGLKQAQWTSLVVFMCLIPLTFLVLHFSKTIPQGEVEATYGIAQKSQKPPQGDRVEGEERRDEPRVDVDERPTLDIVGLADSTVQEAEGTGQKRDN